MAISKEVYSKLLEKGNTYGLPASIWYPIVMTESQGDPLAVGDKGKSHGLFQIYSVAHPDYNVERGKSSIDYQIDYWMPTLVKTYKEGLAKGLSGDDLAVYVERYGERPKWTATVENNVRNYYSDFMNNFDDSTLQYMTLGMSEGTNIPFTDINLNDVKQWLNEGVVIFGLGLIILVGAVLVLFPDITGVIKSAVNPTKLVNKVAKVASG